MRQPLRKNVKNKPKKVVKPKPKRPVYKKSPQQYGTSQLEKDFAHYFLDRYGIQYIYEYEAKDINRFYDFAVVSKKSKYITEEKEGLVSIIQGIQYTPIDLLIEVDGGYWHSDPRIVDESKLNAIQKRNKMVDELKNKWASIHGIPLIRIWEYDIRHNPQKVIDELKKYVSIVEKPQKTRRRVMKLK